MSLVTINWKPTPRELRKFGATVAIGFAIIGGLLYWRGDTGAAYGSWIFGGVAGALGLTGAKVALPLYWAWMGLAFVMGSVMTRVVMALVFYGVVSLLGVITRVLGRDRLALKKRHAKTYWVDLPPAPTAKEDYERQF